MSTKIKRLIDGGTKLVDSHKYKTRFEVKCYKPNIDGKLVLTKIINTTFREPVYRQEYVRICKYPTDGESFKRGPFCEEAFTTITGNALYCLVCRELNRRRQLKMSKIRMKEKRKGKPINKNPFNRHPKLPINKKYTIGWDKS